jgi:cyclic pyranopterin phosphate synthase
VKINVVLKRGENDAGILDLAAWAREAGHVLRFIEYMDVGTTNGWRLDEVVPAMEVIETISARWPLEAVAPRYSGEVAERWRYLDGAGEIGVIASVTRPFCGDCTRARISAEGKLYTCLFSAVGHDLRDPLRAGASDADLAARVAAIWGDRDDRYSERRAAATDRLPKIEMFALGG